MWQDCITTQPFQKSNQKLSSEHEEKLKILLNSKFCALHYIKTPISMYMHLQTTYTLAFNLSTKRFVNKKCPIWFTPSCISMPSFVLVWGHLIMPALFIKISSRWCSVTDKTNPENNLYIKTWQTYRVVEQWNTTFLSCNPLSLFNSEKTNKWTYSKQEHW